MRIAGFAAAAWCLGFAGVSAWQLIAGPPDRFAAYGSGLALMIALVGVLKLIGAVVAVASIRPGNGHERLVATALWGAFGLLALDSAGNVIIAVGTESGLMEPSAAWQAAGGLSVSAVLYALFFLAGALMFGVLAISYHRRHGARWTVAAIGIVGAPVLLVLILVVAPGILGHFGLLPA